MLYKYQLIHLHESLIFKQVTLWFMILHQKLIIVSCLPVFTKMDLPGACSGSAGGFDNQGTQGIASKGKTNKHCLHVQHYL